MGGGSFTVQALFMAANDIIICDCILFIVSLKVAGANSQAQLWYFEISIESFKSFAVNWHLVIHFSEPGELCHFSHLSVTRFLQVFVTLVAGSWTLRRGLCCSSASHSIWFIELNCIVFESLVAPTHERFGCSEANCAQSIWVSTLFASIVSYVSLASFVSKLTWKQIMPHAEQHDA